jgi:hypothetical protein
MTYLYPPVRQFEAIRFQAEQLARLLHEKRELRPRRAARRGLRTPRSVGKTSGRGAPGVEAARIEAERCSVTTTWPPQS